MPPQIDPRIDYAHPYSHHFWRRRAREVARALNEHLAAAGVAGYKYVVVKARAGRFNWYVCRKQLDVATGNTAGEAVATGSVTPGGVVSGSIGAGGVRSGPLRPV